jgi:hypothetical protein
MAERGLSPTDIKTIKNCTKEIRNNRAPFGQRPKGAKTGGKLNMESSQHKEITEVLLYRKLTGSFLTVKLPSPVQNTKEKQTMIKAWIAKTFPGWDRHIIDN